MHTKIAISSQNKKTITGHAGNCNHFFIYTVDTEGNYEKESLKLEKGNTLHDSFQGTAGHNPIFDMDIFLTQSIGKSAIQKLEEKKVRTYIIEESNPETAINKLIEGTLKAFSNEGQHHHDHEHGHGHDHGHGHAGCNCGGGHHHH